MSKRFFISQAAKEVGIHANTLRRWDHKGFLSPERDYLGRRVYTLKDLDRIRARISELHKKGAENG